MCVGGGGNSDNARVGQSPGQTLSELKFSMGRGGGTSDNVQVTQDGRTGARSQIQEQTNISSLPRLINISHDRVFQHVFCKFLFLKKLFVKTKIVRSCTSDLAFVCNSFSVSKTKPENAQTPVHF